MKLVGEFVTRPAASSTFRASALNHELRNHPVKNQSVIKITLLFLPGLLVGKFFSSFRQPHKILHRLRRFFIQQTNHNIALRSLKNCVCSCRSAHQFSLPSTYLSYTTLHRPRHRPAPVSSRPPSHAFITNTIVTHLLDCQFFRRRQRPQGKAKPNEIPNLWSHRIRGKGP